MATLDAALRQFEATEANLQKLNKLWDQIRRHIPSGPAFGSPPEYEELCLAFRRVLGSIPAIGGFRIEDRLYEYDAIGQLRFDTLEIGEIEAQVSTENAIDEQGRQLREYGFKLHAKRRELVRSRILALIEEVDEILRGLSRDAEEKAVNETVSTLGWRCLKPFDSSPIGNEDIGVQKICLGLTY